MESAHAFLTSKTHAFTAEFQERHKDSFPDPKKLEEIIIHIEEKINELLAMEEIHGENRNLFCVALNELLARWRKEVSELLETIPNEKQETIAWMNRFIWSSRYEFLKQFPISKDKTKVHSPRGTVDLHDEYLRKAEKVKERFFSLLRSYGFERIETPTFEHSYIFKVTAPYYPGDKSYIFSDKSWRELILRPDINAPISRAIINTPELRDNLPLKLFFAWNVFRYRSGKGRKREFEMIGVESYGISGFSAQSEIMSIFVQLLESFWLHDYYIEISHLDILKDILRELLETQGVDIDIDNIVYHILSQKSEVDVDALLVTYGVLPKERRLIVEMLECWNKHSASKWHLDTLMTRFPVLQKRYQELVEAITTMDSFGLKNVRFCLWKLEGNGFYSWLCYQIFAGAPKKTADGGSYSHMTQALGWPEIYGTGMGLSLERLVALIEQKGAPILEERKKIGISLDMSHSVPAAVLRTHLSSLRNDYMIEEVFNTDRKKILSQTYKKGYEKIYMCKDSPQGWFTITIYNPIAKDEQVIQCRDLEDLVFHLTNSLSEE